VSLGLDELIDALESRSATWVSGPIRRAGELSVVAGKGGSDVYVFPDTPENVERFLETTTRLRVRVPDFRDED
jgi:hypothetical protein